MCRRNQDGLEHGSHLERRWKPQSQVTGEPKAVDEGILTVENKIHQDLMPYGLHVLVFVCLLLGLGFVGGAILLFWTVFRPHFTEVPVYSLRNRRAQSKTDSFGSVLFSTSLITTFLPFGHGSSSPFP